MSYNHKYPYKNTPEYRAWLALNRRYGSRVWAGWQKPYRDEDWNRRNFNDFVACVGRRPPGHVLISIDKSGHFGPGNVRWGTHSENSKARGPMKKFSYSRDEELIAEIRKRGYTVKRA
jgi:hypothetical protein